MPAGVPIVLYQGLYLPHRGLENLIRAAAGFARARLVLMGWGVLLDTLREVAAREASPGRVIFVDPVPMSELLAVTAGADLGIVP